MGWAHIEDVIQKYNNIWDEPRNRRIRRPRATSKKTV